jgi:hypothetical protein
MSRAALAAVQGQRDALDCGPWPLPVPAPLGLLGPFPITPPPASAAGFFIGIPYRWGEWDGRTPVVVP